MIIWKWSLSFTWLKGTILKYKSTFHDFKKLHNRHVHVNWDRATAEDWQAEESVRGALVHRDECENVSDKIDKDDLRENGQRKGVKLIVGAYLKIFRKFSILRSYSIHVLIAFWTKVLNFKEKCPIQECTIEVSKLIGRRKLPVIAISITSITVRHW